MIFTDQIRLAIDVASRVHHNQKRKDNWSTPVISHPFGVAMILAQYPDISEETIIAGLLHDVLEDVKSNVYSADDMERDFGPEVLAIVRGVSDDTSIPEWKDRKAQYLKQLQQDSLESLMVSAADMTHNLLSYIDGLEHDPQFNKYFTGSPEEMVWFYGERAGLIHKRLDHPIAELALETFSRFEQVITK